MSLFTHPLGETLAMQFPGGWELVIILAIGLLLFGRRLPEVGRSLGRSIVEFKKGIKGIEDEIESSSNGGGKSQSSLPGNESRTVARSDTPQPDHASGSGDASHKPA